MGSSIIPYNNIVSKGILPGTPSIYSLEKQRWAQDVSYETPLVWAVYCVVERITFLS